LFVGACKITFTLSGVSSLKEKRQILKKIIEKTKNRFNVSAAEVDRNDIKRSAVIGFAVAGNSGPFVNSNLDKIIDFVETMYIAEIVDSEIEIIKI